MKITTEITDRDKKLLLFLAIFVIVVVFGFFIIRPLAETDAALKEELAVQEELQIRTPVSYTHLDVYKRQDLYRGIKDNSYGKWNMERVIYVRIIKKFCFK